MANDPMSHFEGDRGEVVEGRVVGDSAVVHNNKVLTGNMDSVGSREDPLKDKEKLGKIRHKMFVIPPVDEIPAKSSANTENTTISTTNSKQTADVGREGDLQKSVSLVKSFQDDLSNISHEDAQGTTEFSYPFFISIHINTKISVDTKRYKKHTPD